MKKRASRMGRPPLPAHKRKRHVLTARLTDADYAALTRAAAAAGLPRSVFLLTVWKRETEHGTGL